MALYPSVEDPILSAGRRMGVVPPKGAGSQPPGDYFDDPRYTSTDLVEAANNAANNGFPEAADVLMQKAQRKFEAERAQAAQQAESQNMPTRDLNAQIGQAQRQRAADYQLDRPAEEMSDEALQSNIAYRQYLQEMERYNASKRTREAVRQPLPIPVAPAQTRPQDVAAAQRMVENQPPPLATNLQPGELPPLEMKPIDFNPPKRAAEVTPPQPSVEEPQAQPAQSEALVPSEGYSEKVPPEWARWEELRRSPEYRGQSAEDQRKVRDVYFNEAIAPKIDPDRLNDVRKGWNEKTDPDIFGGQGIPQYIRDWKGVLQRPAVPPIQPKAPPLSMPANEQALSDREWQQRARAQNEAEAKAKALPPPTAAAAKATQEAKMFAYLKARHPEMSDEDAAKYVAEQQTRPGTPYAQPWVPDLAASTLDLANEVGTGVVNFIGSAASREYKNTAVGKTLQKASETMTRWSNDIRDTRPLGYAVMADQSIFIEDKNGPITLPDGQRVKFNADAINSAKAQSTLANLAPGLVGYLKSAQVLHRGLRALKMGESAASVISLGLAGGAMSAASAQQTVNHASAYLDGLVRNGTLKEEEKNRILGDIQTTLGVEKLVIGTAGGAALGIPVGTIANPALRAAASVGVAAPAMAGQATAENIAEQEKIAQLTGLPVDWKQAAEAAAQGAVMGAGMGLAAGLGRAPHDLGDIPAPEARVSDVTYPIMPRSPEPRAEGPTIEMRRVRRPPPEPQPQPPPGAAEQGPIPQEAPRPRPTIPDLREQLRADVRRWVDDLPIEDKLKVASEASKFVDLGWDAEAALFHVLRERGTRPAEQGPPQPPEPPPSVNVPPPPPAADSATSRAEAPRPEPQPQRAPEPKRPEPIGRWKTAEDVQAEQQAAKGRTFTLRTEEDFAPPPALREPTARVAAPKSAVRGKATTIRAPDNTPINVQYMVVPAGEVITRLGEKGGKNEAYPRELRGLGGPRKETVATAKNIAEALDPKLLGASTGVRDGAPIAGTHYPGMKGKPVVEVGNARAEAIRMAYIRGMGAPYKQALVDQAESLGLDPAAVAAMPTPQLIQVPVGERKNADIRKMVKDSNAEPGAVQDRTPTAEWDPFATGEKVPGTQPLPAPEPGHVRLYEVPGGPGATPVFTTERTVAVGMPKPPGTPAARPRFLDVPEALPIPLPGTRPEQKLFQLPQGVSVAEPQPATRPSPSPSPAATVAPAATPTAEAQAKPQPTAPGQRPAVKTEAPGIAPARVPPQRPTQPPPPRGTETPAPREPVPPVGARPPGQPYTPPTQEPGREAAEPSLSRPPERGQPAPEAPPEAPEPAPGPPPEPTPKDMGQVWAKLGEGEKKALKDDFKGGKLEIPEWRWDARDFFEEIATTLSPSRLAEVKRAVPPRVAQMFQPYERGGQPAAYRAPSGAPAEIPPERPLVATPVSPDSAPRQVQTQEQKKPRTITEAAQQVPLERWAAGTQVLDEYGVPAVVYMPPIPGSSIVAPQQHAAPYSKVAENMAFWFPNASRAAAFFRTENVQAASTSKNVTPVHLNIKNPLRIQEDETPGFLALPAPAREARIKKGGYDGLMIEADEKMQDRGFAAKNWVAFTEEQVRPLDVAAAPGAAEPAPPEAPMREGLAPTEEQATRGAPLPNYGDGSIAPETMAKKGAEADALARARDEFAKRGGRATQLTPQEVKLEAYKAAPQPGDVELAAREGAPPGFYSQLERTIERKMPNRATPQQYLNLLDVFQKKGDFKADEIEHSGLRDWIKGSAYAMEHNVPIQKQQLLDYLGRQGAVLGEKQLAPYDPSKDPRYALKQAVMDAEEALIAREPAFGVRTRTASRERLRLEQANAALWEYDRTHGVSDQPQAQYRNWTIPGGENYREILLTLPGGEFTPPHFGVKGLLVHMRVDDRTDVAGRKTLFIEEIQSDWHQAGRKHGYRTKPRSEFVQRAVAAGHIDPLVPPAPFTKTWHELALKRLLREAADGSYDQLAWTTGAQQDKRYNLGTHFQRIDWTADPEGQRYVIHAITPDGRRMDVPADTDQALQDTVGQRPATLITEAAASGKRAGTLTAEDIQAGSGMFGFYDRMIPQFLDKYTKKWGGRVGETEIRLDTGQEPALGMGFGLDGLTLEPDRNPQPITEPVHSLVLTPALRKAVLEEGQPLFTQETGGGGKAPPPKPPRPTAFAEPPERPRDWKESTEYIMRRLAANALKPEYPLGDILGELHRILPADSPFIQIVDRLSGNRSGGWSFSGADGRRLIELAMNAQRPRRDAFHEAVHDLRKVALDPHENRILNEKFKPSGEAARRLIEYLKKERNAPAIEDLGIQEERIAYGAGMAYEGKPIFDRVTNRILQKLVDWWERFVNAVRGMGWQNAKDIYERILSGEVGRRGVQPKDKRGVGFDAKDRGAPADVELAARQGTGAGPERGPDYPEEPHKLTDKLFKLVTDIAHVGQAVGAAKRWIDAKTPDRIKAGLWSSYGRDAVLMAGTKGMYSQEKAGYRTVQDLIKQLPLSPAESRVFFEWMEAKPNTPLAERLIAQLPAESRGTMQQMKRLIRELGAEMVRLEMLPEDAFKRNEFAYLRHLYVKYELREDGSLPPGRKRAINILGQTTMRRGPETQEVEKGALVAANLGHISAFNKGDRYWHIIKRSPEGKTLRHRFFPQDGPFAQKYVDPDGNVRSQAGWTTDTGIGDVPVTWEIRGERKNGKLFLGRDWTQAERDRWGQIHEGVYVAARTMMDMIRDVETGRYLKWISENPAWAIREKADLPPGHEIVTATSWRDRALQGYYGENEWVQVPDTKIPKSAAKKYGKLAGMYVPGPVWAEVSRAFNRNDPGPFGAWFDAWMKTFKSMKTAWTPKTHIGNLGGNLLLMDAADLRVKYLLKSLYTYIKASRGDQAAIDTKNKFEDAGGSFGSYALSELRHEIMDPLEADLRETLGVALREAKDFEGGLEKFKALLHLEAIQTALIKANEKAVGAYQFGDNVFRLAMFLQEKELHKASDTDAAHRAADAFLDYDINAPWVNIARKTGLPFISFQYAIINKTLDVAEHKPYKLLKWITYLTLLGYLGYAFSGGDEKEERRLMPEGKRGKLFGIGPHKMLRMPWNWPNKSPVFDDITNFMPIGQMFQAEDNQMIPGLPFLTPGGPASQLMELIANRQNYTGRDIYLKKTSPSVLKGDELPDTGKEILDKIILYIWRANMPNSILTPRSYDWEKAGMLRNFPVIGAESFRMDPFGREYPMLYALLGTLGINVAAFPKDASTLRWNQRAEATIRALENQGRHIAIAHVRGAIDKATYNQRIDALRVKGLEQAAEFIGHVSPEKQKQVESAIADWKKKYLESPPK